MNAVVADGLRNSRGVGWEGSGQKENFRVRRSQRSRTSCMASPIKKTMFCSATTLGSRRRNTARVMWNSDSARMSVYADRMAMVGSGRTHVTAEGRTVTELAPRMEFVSVCDSSFGGELELRNSNRRPSHLPKAD